MDPKVVPLLKRILHLLLRNVAKDPFEFEILSPLDPVKPRPVKGFTITPDERRTR